MIQKIAEDLKKYTIELGKEGTLLKLRLKELLKDVDGLGEKFIVRIVTGLSFFDSMWSHRIRNSSLPNLPTVSPGRTDLISLLAVSVDVNRLRRHPANSFASLLFLNLVLLLLLLLHVEIFRLQICYRWRMLLECLACL